MDMEKGVSQIISFVMVIVVVIASSVALYYWIGGRKTPRIQEEYLKISAYAVNSTAIKVINQDTEDSEELTSLSTSVGPCSFSSSTVLKPGIPVICFLSNPVPNGTTIKVYGPKIQPVQVDF